MLKVCSESSPLYVDPPSMIPNSLYCALTLENEAKRTNKRQYLTNRIDMNLVGKEDNKREYRRKIGLESR